MRKSARFENHLVPSIRDCAKGEEKETQTHYLHNFFYEHADCLTIKTSVRS